LIKRIALTILAVASLSIQSNQALAGGCACALPVFSGDSKVTKTDYRGYAGLAWKLDGSFIPDISFGFRSLRVDSNDSVQGGDVNGRISLKDKTFDSVRLSFVGGSRDVMGNIGAGYSFTQSSLLGTAAIEGAYLRLGSDYLLSTNSFSPYLEVNSLARPNKVNSKQNFACPVGSTLHSVTEISPGNYVLTGTGTYVNSPYVYDSGKGLETCY